MSLLARFSIKSRLWLLAAITVVFTLVIVGVVYTALDKVNENFKVYNEVGVAGQSYTLMISRDMNYVSRLTRAIMLKDNYEKNLNKLNKRISDIEGHFANLAKAAQVSADVSFIEAVEAATRDTRAFLEDGRQRMLALGKVERTSDVLAAAYKAYRKEASPLANKARGSFRQLIKITDNNIEQSLHDSSTSITDTKKLLPMVGIGAALLGFGLAFFIVRSITRPIEILQNNIETIERESNLARRIELDSHDELGAVASATNSMLDRFHQLIQGVASSSAELVEGVRRVAAITEETSNGVRRQQDEVDQVATAINEMTSTVQEVASHASATAESTTAADNEARNGQRVVSETVTAINELARNVEHSTGVIHELEKDSENIGSVLDVIRGIAEQTNLLALNAAIEAARAGEQGRGFAVVADEVRTLASRTQESTQEIQETIERLQAGAEKAVQAMDASRQQAETNVSQAQAAGESLNNITRSVQTISDMNTQIASAAQEQSGVATEINSNIQAISEIAERTALGAQSNTEAAAEIEKLAIDLQQQVGRFRL